jgi:hypothetical protein
MSVPTVYWCVPEHADMVWHRWDDEYVFHHRLSNDTHQLSDAAGAVVCCLLQHGELDTSALVDCSGLTRETLGPILQTLANMDFVTWR